MVPKVFLHHAGQGNSSERKKLKPVMEKLHENQSGEGRHKCPYCAYEKGYAAGYKKARRDLGSRSI